MFLSAMFPKNVNFDLGPKITVHREPAFKEPQNLRSPRDHSPTPAQDLLPVLRNMKSSHLGSLVMIAYRNSSSTVSFVNIVVIVAPRTSGDAHTPRILASTVLLEEHLVRLRAEKREREQIECAKRRHIGQTHKGPHPCDQPSEACLCSAQGRPHFLHT